MSGLPKTGLYISTKNKIGIKICVEDVFGDNPEEFYLVEITNETDRDDFSAIGDELDKEQWESLVSEFGLVYQD